MILLCVNAVLNLWTARRLVLRLLLGARLTQTQQLRLPGNSSRRIFMCLCNPITLGSLLPNSWLKKGYRWVGIPDLCLLVRKPLLPCIPWVLPIGQRFRLETCRLAISGGISSITRTVSLHLFWH